MLTHRAIRREYDEAGSVNALLALWAFVDEGTFVTKAGDVGVVYRLQGQDYEGLDHAQRRHVVHRFEAALRLLGERSRVYQYFFKRQGLVGDPSPELRRRLETLLSKLQGPITSTETLRSLRAIEVLEHIATPEARELLQKLARGAPEARLTREAKTAVERLGRR
jgi:type IV secretory pathway VirB4 component